MTEFNSQQQKDWRPFLEHLIQNISVLVFPDPQWEEDTWKPVHSEPGMYPADEIIAMGKSMGATGYRLGWDPEAEGEPDLLRAIRHPDSEYQRGNNFSMKKDGSLVAEWTLRFPPEVVRQCLKLSLREIGPDEQT
jgi:hypothetical protein